MAAQCFHDRSCGADTTVPNEPLACLGPALFRNRLSRQIDDSISIVEYCLPMRRLSVGSQLMQAADDGSSALALVAFLRKDSHAVPVLQ